MLISKELTIKLSEELKAQFSEIAQIHKRKRIHFRR